MNMFNGLQRIWDFVRNRFDSGYYGGMASESGIMERREKVTVFVMSILIALVMWVVVNLGRDLSTTVQFELSIGELPDNLALASDLPGTITASVSGEGWKLLPLRNNTQTIAIDINQAEILLADMIREKVGPTGVNVLAVQPAILRTVLEERISKRVPIQLQQSISFRGQHNLVGNLKATPDSVTISGARSIVENIKFWPTRPLELANVNSDISEQVLLQQLPMILASDILQTMVSAQVSEYTEGEQRVRVDVSDLPFGTDVTFNPAYVTIRYTIPIDEYAQSQTEPLFSALVPYSDIRLDSTGYISPMITTLSDSLNAKVRSVQPRRVSYFEVIR
jgi:YbbR domain-containing protein